MNTTYTLTEGNDALNRVLLMMQYELGKTLDEQRSDFAMDRQANAIARSTGIRSQKDYETTEKIIKKANSLPSKTMTLDEFMEGYRETLTHPVMVGLEVALTSTGYGAGVVVAAYTALLAYDVYKGVVEKDWDWLNIVFDVLGIVSSGVLSSTLRPIMKGAQGLKFKNFQEVFTYLTKTNKWYEIKPYLETGFSVLKSVSKGIWKALEWISRKTGFRQLKVAGKSVEVMIQNIIYSVEEFLKSSVKKTVKFLEPGANVGIKQALKRGLISAGLAAALPLGINAVYDKLIKPKLKGGSFEYTKLDPVDNGFLRAYYVKNNKEYFPNGINKIEFASDKQKNLIGLRIDGKMYQIVDPKKYKLKKI
jgi:hypothetical protein